MSTAILVMGTTVATGTFLVYGLSALFVAFGSFKSIFFVAGSLVPIIAIIWLFAYPFLTQKSAEAETEDGENTTEQLSEQAKTQGWKGLLGAIILFAVFAVVDNLVKDGLTMWVPTILKETYGLPDYVSILLTLLLPVLAIFGTAVTVELHKKIKNFVWICALLFLVSAALIGAVLGFLPTGALVVTIACFALVSCLMSGVNNVLTSMAPLYWKDKINSGALAGVLNGFCYLGSTISSYGLGAVADAGGPQDPFGPGV
jgi:OPA family glycerol-3-phosphate transporter-like MFS transporter